MRRRTAPTVWVYGYTQSAPQTLPLLRGPVNAGVRG